MAEYEYYTSRVPFEKLEIGDYYFAKEQPEYERNNEGYEYPIWDPSSYLVKVISKNNSHNSVNVEIIRNYENRFRPYPYPPEQKTLSSYYFEFEKPTKKELANISRKKTLNQYKKQLVSLRAIKKTFEESGLPINVASNIAPFVTGVSSKSNIVGVPSKTLKNQIKNLHKKIKNSEKKFRFEEPPKPLLNGGRRKTRRHRLKRGFKSQKRKTT